jgi:hypothetical protein
MLYLKRLLSSIVERLDSKKPHVRNQVVELLHFLVQNGPIEWHETMVQHSELISLWIKNTTPDATRIHLVDKVPEWAALQADGPFAQGYHKLLAQIAVDVPNRIPISTLPPHEDRSLSKMRLAQEISNHCESVTTACELFVETLNFNQGYIGNNELARELHTQCKDLKITNDLWIHRTDLNESLTGF